MHKRECKRIARLGTPRFPILIHALTQITSGIDESDNELYKPMLTMKSNREVIKAQDPQMWENYKMMAQLSAGMLGQDEVDTNNNERLATLMCTVSLR